MAIADPARATVTADLRDACSRLGLRGDIQLEPLPGGRNNRVYALRACGDRFFLKAYFTGADDGRERLRREFAFLQYAAAAGVGCVARPVAADHEANLAIYEFIDGRRPRLEEVTSHHVSQAAAFYAALNARSRPAEASGLPPAAEACFSIREQLDLVSRRVARLGEIPAGLDVDRAAALFAAETVAPLWHRVRAAIDDASAIDLDEVLGAERRCLSPSDFGFHNALTDERGALRFVDFEYAGWDDPAKLVCDFANQPDMLLPPALAAEFEQEVVRRDPDPAALRLRIAWLRPVFQLKWACIILNDFLPVGSTRARFTGAADERTRKAAQLEKSRRMLASAAASLSRVAEQ